MIVLGIDPGTASTGYGVVKGDGLGLVSLVECGVIRTRARDPLASRLREIYDGVTELIARHRPDALSVEDVFYAKNVRTTVVLGHARGVVLLAGAAGRLEIARVSAGRDQEGGRRNRRRNERASAVHADAIAEISNRCRSRPTPPMAWPPRSPVCMSARVPTIAEAQRSRARPRV